MREHGLSIQRSCRIAGLSRTAFYRVPRSAAERDALVIEALNRQVDDWRGTELGRARRMLARGAGIDEVLDALSRGLTQKMLHGAMAELHAADGTHRTQVAHTVSRLFLRQTPRDPADDKR